ncbi:hypothetical protein AYO44_16085 [Planctomycetaceae bacterium SCGC AG-212-F19]|nr:hypothetical protein AYO44_16085 [Planctomycetaceae bacterium SCGC AG-212-F19]
MKLLNGMMLAGLCCLAFTGVAAAAEPAKAEPAKPEAFTFSGPYTYQNLTIFLVHGKDSLPGKKFLTLPEALEQKKIVVHETKNVNELSVENISIDVEIFIQSGDVVKGGQQDRVLGYDLIVPAKSGKVPILSFCVEAGRWSQRGGESAGQFGSSMNNASGKSLKLAVNFARKQDEVWAKVQEAQQKLAKNVGQSVQSKDSPTSLQLTLEDKKLLESLDAYVKAMVKLTDGKKDVIGYVTAVNGKIDGADIFGSPVLFTKAWPRLLKGCAVDALAEFDKDKKVTQPTVEDVKKFLTEAEQGKKETKKDVSPRCEVQTKEAEKNLLIESRDRENKDVFLRRNYIAK